MQLVIDIDEEDYERLKHYKKAPFCSLTSRTYEAIANGTPLPKGHGRLIDADALYDQFEYADYDFEETLEYAPTIVPADKEGEE